MNTITRAAGTLLTAATIALSLAATANAAVTTAAPAHIATSVPTSAGAGHGGNGGGSGGGHGAGSSSGSAGTGGHGGNNGGGQTFNTDAVPCPADCGNDQRDTHTRPRPLDPRPTDHGCGDPYNYDQGYYGCNQPQR